MSLLGHISLPFFDYKHLVNGKILFYFSFSNISVSSFIPSEAPFMM